MRIAHISDLHFSKATFNPLQFFSKRWLGNLNLLFCRKREFRPEQLAPLAELFKSLHVDLVLISGDLSCTSLPREFRLAADFVDSLAQQGMQVVTIPGNHDHYTKTAYKKRHFYRFFASKFAQSPYDLSAHGIAVKELSNGWFLIALDTALATSLISSRGYFSPEIEERLEMTLATLPRERPIILVNHFPFFDTEGPYKALVRGDALRNLIAKYPAIKLYLHGHSHRQTIANLQASGLPIILDSGSVSHHIDGSFLLIDIDKKSCQVEPYAWKNSQWQAQETQRFQLI